jgi:signal peptidase I
MIEYGYLSSVIVLLILVLVACPAYPQEQQGSGDCVTKEEPLTVRGDSLAPLVNPGSTIRLLYGYYNCHSPEREDIVAYSYAGNEVPIIKIVKGVPQDKWLLEKVADGYQIIVNGSPLKNSEGKLYQIPEINIRMLQLYARTYPVLPGNTYLILGNQPSGTKDSTTFGVIDKSNIIGKVIKE